MTGGTNLRGRKMEQTKHRSNETPNHVLFPMAVGALFIMMLVAGAFLG
jgi:hypothetical protein